MTQQTEPKRSYKETLNLPRTGFAMKANLVQNEPASMKRWAEQKLYERIRQARAGSPRYVFHDGPPYANGSIHLGHLLNKVLKDLVVRTRTMLGFDCPYVPGWDCHGLPIEHRVVQDLAEKARSMDAMQVRHRCRAYAEKHIKLQATQMQRLLTLADYDHPYLTMAPDYEAATLEVFADLVEKGLVYRALKPVHWSIANQTALAEAELEYEDRVDTSVYVRFSKRGGRTLEQAHEKLADADLLIWTTTPWTLPANRAIAVNPDEMYGVYPTSGRPVIIAEKLSERVLRLVGIESTKPILRAKGHQLVGVDYQHPFLPWPHDSDQFRVVAADYVTCEEGTTGLVHTAPGHGTEDYHTGIREGLDIYCPVKADGTFDDTAPQWLRGKSVWEANELVTTKLRESGHLFHAHQFTHSYPHDWRSKTPVIFRATEQWFVSVDKPVGPGQTLRGRALEATATDVRFIPEWGRNRMRGMLESRPDWCLSRQRAWGLPIPAFFNENGEPLLTAASVSAVADVVRQHGSDAWFRLPPEELLKTYDPTKDPQAPAWAHQITKSPNHQITKSLDIFDVWFESGSSWHAVIRQRFGDDWFPTDLYLEGSDQHRGWFQLSLLPAIGVTGQAPFKAVLTHGFMVDKDGRKMSKSLGNALEVEDLLKAFGADVCRWWVCALNTENDIKVDQSFFQVAGEEYRKVRNTIRFLLSNLFDYDDARDRHAFTAADATSIDAWALSELAALVKTVRQAYTDFQFRDMREAVFDFCNETMSAVYLAAVKDRLYCDAPGSARRRRTQTAIHDIADALIRLIAPVLPHSADEAWRAIRGQDAESVHLQLLPDTPAVAADPNWPALMRLREDWLKAIEETRQRHDIDNPLDTGIALATEHAWLDRFDPIDLADLCGISQFAVTPGGPTLNVIDLRHEPRCERSWKRDGTVQPRDDGGLLSDRDAAAVGASG